MTEFTGIRNYEDLFMWIKRNEQHTLVEDDAHLPQEDRIRDSAFWFMALTEATIVNGSYSLKDVARLFLDGIPPMSIARINELISEDWEDINSDDKELVAEVIELQLINLKNHYGIT